MKSSSPARTRSRLLIKATPVAAAVAAVLYGPGLAMAQTAGAAAPTQSDVVTITGIRRGIESAIAVKKNAEGIVEALSSEDIGKLPDTTIAESLARLPGLTTQRDRNGNATSINIRGLGPDFNGYMLNGREQTSTGDSRGVDLSVYPAELIDGATIYKSARADLATAGLAGTIDIRLVDPLARKGRVIAGSVTRNKYDVGLPSSGKPSSGNRVSLAYVDQFMDRTLGLAIGFVRSKSDSSSIADGSWGNNANITTTGGATGTYNIPFGGGLSIETDVRSDERTGVAAILNYKPNKNFQTELNVYSAKIKTALKKNALKGGTFGGAVTNATVTGGTVNAGVITGGQITGGTFQLSPDGLIVYSENLFDDDKIDSLGWKSTLKFAPGWTGTLDVNSNKAKRVEKDIEAYAGVASNPGTLSFSNYTGSGVPQLTLSNPSAYTSPASLQVRDQSGWSGVSYPTGSPFAGQTVPQAGYSKGPTITDKLDGVRAEVRKELGNGMFSDVQLGLNYTKRSKDRVTDEGLVVSTQPGGYGRIAYPSSAYVFNNVAGSGLNVLTFDPQDGLWSGATVLRKYNDDILSKTWGVQEKVTTAFAQFNIDTNAGNVPLTGNVGLQIVGTDQSATGYRAQVGSSVTLTNPAGNQRTDGTTYTDVLPSLNLKGDFGGGNFLRFAVGKQIARPDLTALRNSFAASVDTNPSSVTFNRFVGSAGNPALKPFKATAVDLSYEKYWGNKANFAVAAFYKGLDTYITKATNTSYDFTSAAQQLGLTIPAAGPIGTYTTTINGRGGRVNGFEVAGQLPFSMLSPVLDGFGLSATYSNTNSSVVLPNLIGANPNQQVPVGGTATPLPGLSKDNASLRIYFERWGFSAYVSQSYRSKYVGSVANSTVGGYPALAYIYAQNWVSAQIGYEIQDGPMKGLSVRFEGNNLNKPDYRENTGNGVSTNKTGATYGLRASYKFE